MLSRGPASWFGLRLVVALVVSLGLVAAAAVPVAERSIRHSAADEGARMARSDARAVEVLVRSAEDPEAGLAAVTRLLTALVLDARVVDVRLIAPDARTIASPRASELGEVERERAVRDALRLGRSFAGSAPESGDRSGDQQYVVPVLLPGGRHALELDQDAGFVDDQVRGARRLVLLGVVLAVLACTALFYLLGGRRLGRLHQAALHSVAERRRSEALLDHQRRQLEEAQAVGGFGSWEWDVAAGTSTWSAELHRIYGLQPTAEPVALERAVALVHPGDRDAVLAVLEAVEPFALEHRIVRPDGTVRVLHARAEVVAGEDGAPLRVLGTCQDVTERRAAERAKDEFTSLVSHELRTPLTSLRGSLGLLQSGVLGPLPDKGQRMVEIAVENTDRLVRLINDILDLERITSGSIDLRPQPCRAADLLEGAVGGIAQLAAQAGVALQVSPVDVPVSADADRVVQTLVNLVSNAIKFSPPGSTVRLSCHPDPDGVRFDVTDQGRGIPADKLDAIFERFQQVDASDAREKGGTGLGLAICRTIVERHGGRIWVHSTPGHGSTFSFVLPAGHPVEAADQDRPDGRPTVLVCDDDAGVVEVVGAMLAQRGYRAIPAHSGEQALARAAADRPDAILLDLLMPATDGEATAAALGREPATRGIPVLVLSALSAAEHEELRDRFFAWIEKPIDEAALFAALERAIGPPGDRDGYGANLRSFA